MPGGERAGCSRRCEPGDLRCRPIMTVPLTRLSSQMRDAGVLQAICDVTEHEHLKMSARSAAEVAPISWIACGAVGRDLLGARPAGVFPGS